MINTRKLKAQNIMPKKYQNQNVMLTNNFLFYYLPVALGTAFF
jgi:hypothetical protein